MLFVVEADAADDGHVFGLEEVEERLDAELGALFCRLHGRGALVLDGPEVVLCEELGELAGVGDEGLAEGLAARVVDEADETAPGLGGHVDV